MTVPTVLLSDTAIRDLPSYHPTTHNKRFDSHATLQLASLFVPFPIHPRSDRHMYGAYSLGMTAELVRFHLSAAFSVQGIDGTLTRICGQISL